jgi:trimethylamine--corrinoid protein Co-methyltransferase
MSVARIRYFSQDELALMRERLFGLLERRGVNMDHPEVIKLLDRAGARVDSDTQTVCFPKEFLEEQISKAPKSVSLFDRDGENELKLPREDGTFHTRTNTGAQSWIDPESGAYRRVTISDVATWARLVDLLENIGFSAFPVPGDVPAGTADVHALRAMLQNSEKHVWVQPYTIGSVEYLVRLSVAAAGGQAALKARPPVSFITCSLSPLSFKELDLEIIMQCARHGIPLHPCSLPSAGTTGPITEPGVVLLSVAEILAMLATAQVIEPGTPIVATPLIFSADMRTCRSLQSSAESLRSCALAVQLIKAAFRLPTHTYGTGADSPDLDGQCMGEGALRAMLIAASGADILGAAGQIEVATTISPVQLVIDDEVFGMARRIVSQMSFDDEALAWEDLMNVSAGDHFLTTAHTVRHCRDGLPPKSFIRSSRESWEREGGGDLIARATRLYRELMETSQAVAEPVTRDQDVISEMASIVEGADARLL